jgi:hypothetical protein
MTQLPTRDSLIEAEIKRLNAIVTRLQAVGKQVYAAPRTNVDNALPRDVIDEAIAEILKLKNAISSFQNPFIDTGDTPK